MPVIVPLIGNVGMPELLVILFVVLVAFGAKRLPEIGASMGKGIREFKKSIREVRDDIEDADHEVPGNRRLDAPPKSEETSSPRGEPKKLGE